jgi:hypothetical protein
VKGDLMAETYIPTLSIDLIELLDKTYGPVNPVPSDTMEVIMFKAGRRAVVQKLLDQLEIDKDNV